MPLKNVVRLAVDKCRPNKEKHIIKNIFSLFRTKHCICPEYLVGKTALVTGGSSGIGFETAKILASHGAKVIIADKQNAKQAEESIIHCTHNKNVQSKSLDLSSLEGIREFAGEIKANQPRLDILVNNAGVGGLIHNYTSDLLQEEMQINHFGPFLLTHLLIDLLRESKPSRIVFVSSALAYLNNLSVKNLNTISDFPVMDFLVYSNSKLCNIIAAKGFAERLRGQGITCNALHPGFVNTNLYKHMRGDHALDFLKKIIYLFLHLGAKTPWEGAQTVAYLAISDEFNRINGKFYIECMPFAPPAKINNIEFCDAIWEASENFVHLRPSERLKLKPESCYHTNAKVTKS